MYTSFLPSSEVQLLLDTLPLISGSGPELRVWLAYFFEWTCLASQTTQINNQINFSWIHQYHITQTSSTWKFDNIDTPIGVMDFSEKAD